MEQASYYSAIDEAFRKLEQTTKSTVCRHSGINPAHCYTCSTENEETTHE